MFYRFLPNDKSRKQEISHQLSMESSNSLGQDVFYDAQVGEGGRKLARKTSAFRRVLNVKSVLSVLKKMMMRKKVRK